MKPTIHFEYPELKVSSSNEHRYVVRYNNRIVLETSDKFALGSYIENFTIKMDDLKEIIQSTIHEALEYSPKTNEQAFARHNNQEVKNENEESTTA